MRRAIAAMGRWLILTTLALLCESVVCADLYSALGLERGAGAVEIKKAYRSLSLVYHPDKHQRSSEDDKARASQRFVEIQKAYSILSDPERKRTYDLEAHFGEHDQEATQDGARSRRRGSWDSDSTADSISQRAGFQHSELISSETMMLTEKNFDKVVFRSNKAYLVQVYDDTSILCQRSAPQWEQSSRVLHGLAQLGRVDAHNSATLVQKLGSSALFSIPVRRSDLPVIFGFRPGCRHFSCAKRYHGPVKVERLSTFVSEKLLGLKNIKKANKEFLSAKVNGKSVFALISAKQPSLLFRHLATEHQEEVTVAHIDFKDNERTFWSERYGVVQVPSLIIFKENSEPTVEYVGSKDKLKSVFKKHRLQSVPELTKANAGALGCIPGGLAQTCFVIVDSPRSTSLTRWKSFVTSIQRDFDVAIEDEVKYTWIDSGAAKTFCNSFADRQTSALVALVFDHEKENIVRYDSVALDNQSRVRHWIGDILSSNIHDSLRSAHFSTDFLPDARVMPINSSIWRALIQDLSDIFESLWLMVLHYNIIPLVLTIVTAAGTTWLRRLVVRVPSVGKRKQAVKANMTQKDVAVYDINGVLQNGKSVYTATIFSLEGNLAFRKVAGKFEKERLLAFVEVNDATIEAFGSPNIYDRTGNMMKIIVWHPSKEKYTTLSDLGDPNKVGDELNDILNGGADWTSAM